MAGGWWREVRTSGSMNRLPRQTRADRRCRVHLVITVRQKDISSQKAGRAKPPPASEPVQPTRRFHFFHFLRFPRRQKVISLATKLPIPALPDESSQPQNSPINIQRASSTAPDVLCILLPTSSAQRISSSTVTVAALGLLSPTVSFYSHPTLHLHILCE